MILDGFSRAVGQMGDPRFTGVLAKALVLTIAVFVALCVVLGLVVSSVVGAVTLPFIGTFDAGALATGLAVGTMMIASIFLMIPVASICVGFFLDDIASAVEDSHYPDLPHVTPLPLGDVLVDSLRFFGVLAAANLVALIFYLFSGPFAPLVFYALNGFLLGREYFQLVALRRLPPAEATRLRKAHFPKIWAAGTLMAVPLSIPLVNLLIPLLGVATFTHLFHSVNR
ncbi:MAG: EI24 domain-containing protein [Pseudomonadota bacterium]